MYGGDIVRDSVETWDHQDCDRAGGGCGRTSSLSALETVCAGFFDGVPEGEAQSGYRSASGPHGGSFGEETGCEIMCDQLYGKRETPVSIYFK